MSSLSSILQIFIVFWLLGCINLSSADGGATATGIAAAVTIIASFAIDSSSCPWNWKFTCEYVSFDISNYFCDYNLMHWGQYGGDTYNVNPTKTIKPGTTNKGGQFWGYYSAYGVQRYALELVQENDDNYVYKTYVIDLFGCGDCGWGTNDGTLFGMAIGNAYDRGTHVPVKKSFECFEALRNGEKVNNKDHECFISSDSNIDTGYHLYDNGDKYYNQLSFENSNFDGPGIKLEGIMNDSGEDHVISINVYPLFHKTTC